MMNSLKKSSIQFDYFSDNYQKFENDFYRHSALNIPLTFLTDDLIHLMESTGNHYFRLNASNAKDHRDHLFLFKCLPHADNPEVKKYVYIGSQSI